MIPAVEGPAEGLPAEGLGAEGRLSGRGPEGPGLRLIVRPGFR